MIFDEYLVAPRSEEDPTPPSSSGGVVQPAFEAHGAVIEPPGVVPAQAGHERADEGMSDERAWSATAGGGADPVPVGLDLPAAPPRPGSMDGPRRVFGDSGYVVEGPFLAFFEHYGPTLCGPPISGELLLEGRRTQLFERLALEEFAPGRVRPRALGRDWLQMARLVQGGRGGASATTRPSSIDLVDQLPRGEGAYPRRTLAEIRYLVVHHTGAAPEITPHEIASEHVGTMGWPGIGYHYVVGVDGTLWRCQDLTTVSHHARQFNGVSVGVALAGNFTLAAPGAVQLERCAALLAGLLDELGLPPDVVRGHGELVPTGCPGETFVGGWKAKLMSEVARLGPPAFAL
jgi:hypothetical protein